MQRAQHIHYKDMESLAPMLTSLPVNHECDTKGGYDSYSGRIHITRLHGMNGLTGGRTRTVSSGYTSDKDLEETLHLTNISGDKPAHITSTDIARLDDVDDMSVADSSSSITSATLHGTARWLECSSPSYSGSRDSNKDSGTGTDCVPLQHQNQRKTAGSACTLTASNSSPTSFSPQCSATRIRRPSSDGHLHSAATTTASITPPQALPQCAQCVSASHSCVCRRHRPMMHTDECVDDDAVSSPHLHAAQQPGSKRKANSSQRQTRC